MMNLSNIFYKIDVFIKNKLKIIGPHATDLLREGTLAVSNNLGVADIANTIHAHPTLAEILLEAALRASGKALHG